MACSHGIMLRGIDRCHTRFLRGNMCGGCPHRERIAAVYAPIPPFRATFGSFPLHALRVSNNVHLRIQRRSSLRPLEQSPRFKGEC